MNITIRKFQSEDQKNLARIYFEARQETFHWMPDDSFNLSDFEPDTKGEVIYVALEDAKPVGFVSIWMEDNFIHHLYIDSKYQNKGVGKKLLNFALSKMGRPASLKCVVRNKRAVDFYKSGGWKIEETATDEMGPYHLFVYYL